METFYIVVGTVLYTLIAVRVAVVTNRACIRSNKESERLLSSFAGAIWPVMTTLYGFAVLVSGETGIFGHRK